MRAGTKESLLPPLWILALIAAVVGVWIAMQLKELLVLMVLGYFIAYALDPVLVYLEKRGISRMIGFFALCGVVIAAFALLAISAIPMIVAEFEKLSLNLNQYIVTGKAKALPLIESIRELIPKAILERKDLSSVVESAPSLTEYISGDGVKAVFAGVLKTLLSGYSIGLTLINIALLPFIVFYLAVDLPQIHALCVGLAPVTRRRRFVQIFREIDVYVSSFVRGQFIVCSILFLLYAVGLGLVGVDLWFLLAVISGFGNLIPYAGFLVGILLSSLMALVTFGDFSHLFWVWGVYATVQFLEGTFITPRVIGESVGLPPLVIIIALFAGGQLFGLLGIFLAVPAAAALRVLSRHSYGWVLNRQ